jgi:hypothetical protein
VFKVALLSIGLSLLVWQLQLRELARSTPIQSVLIVRCYDIRDIVIPLHNSLDDKDWGFKMPDIHTEPVPAWEPTFSTDSVISELTRAYHNRVKSINRGLPGASPAIVELSGQLIVTTTPEAHHEVARYLDRMRQARDGDADALTEVTRLWLLDAARAGQVSCSLRFVPLTP